MHETWAGSTDCVVLSLRVSDASVSCVILCGPVQVCRRRMSCAVTLGTLGGPERAALCSRLVSPWDGLCARQAVRIAGTCLMVVPGKVGLRHACFYLLAPQIWPALEKGPQKVAVLGLVFRVAQSEGALCALTLCAPKNEARNGPFFGDRPRQPSPQWKRPGRPVTTRSTLDLLPGHSGRAPSVQAGVSMPSLFLPSPTVAWALRGRRIGIPFSHALCLSE